MPNSPIFTVLIEVNHLRRSSIFHKRCRICQEVRDLFGHRQKVIFADEGNKVLLIGVIYNLLNDSIGHVSLPMLEGWDLL